MEQFQWSSFLSDITAGGRKTRARMRLRKTKMKHNCRGIPHHQMSPNLPLLAFKYQDIIAPRGFVLQGKKEAKAAATPTGVFFKVIYWRTNETPN